MKNSDPRLAEIRLKNLESGRGKRPKLDHQFVGMRLSPQSRERLEEIAALQDKELNRALVETLQSEANSFMSMRTSGQR